MFVEPYQNFQFKNPYAPDNTIIDISDDESKCIENYTSISGNLAPGGGNCFSVKHKIEEENIAGTNFLQDE